MVARYVGVNDGLASERTYMLHTLPRAIMHYLIAALLHQDLAGLARGAAIVIGLGVTTAGYLVGSVSLPMKKLKHILSRKKALLQNSEVITSTRAEL
jgi:hypothetical protein